MPYATRLLLLVTSLPALNEELRDRIQRLLDECGDALDETILSFIFKEISPSSTQDFEQRLAEEMRELGRQLMELTVNLLDPEDPEGAPHDVTYASGGYRRLNRKTRNAHVGTLFGTIELWRRGYRYWHQGEGEKTVFPLELQLGLVCGATPGLAGAASRYMAEAGATQAAVLARLKQQHNVAWGAERLRDVVQQVGQAMEGLLREHQAFKILELLERATASRGNRKPVLSVGRDGISLCEYKHRFYEVATTGTITVYDRTGNRLGTVYLALPPELGQQEMSDQLTALIQEVLHRWEGSLPRLAYVTDAGDSETRYYRRVLRKMRHPRTGEQLKWIRIVDYYHASERIWAMAHALFAGDERKAQSWARRMCRLLKKPNGPSRVLHSAGAHHARLKLSKTREDEYAKASNYIRTRTQFMQYADYKADHLPLGSGVTEAACKTIFTQRLKLSGMRWTKQGARTILTLRIVVLSGIWDNVYTGVLESNNPRELETYEPNRKQPVRKAA